MSRLDYCKNELIGHSCYDWEHNRCDMCNIFKAYCEGARRAKESQVEAPKPTGELISKADAIALLTEIVFDEPPYFDSETLCRLYAEEQINTLSSVEIAETESIAIRSRTLMPTKDFKEWAKRVRETNPNVIVIPCDAEVVSAEAVQGEWIEKDGELVCSVCGNSVSFSRTPKGWVLGKFCQSCGAKMTKGGDDK